MRPVDRGAVPTDTDGNPKVFKAYADARADLFERTSVRPGNAGEEPVGRCGPDAWGGGGPRADGWGVDWSRSAKGLGRTPAEDEQRSSKGRPQGRSRRNLLSPLRAPR